MSKLAFTESNVVKAFKKAFNVHHNHFSDGTPNWDYIFADVFMDIDIDVKSEDSDRLQTMCDHLADDVEDWGIEGLTFFR